MQREWSANATMQPGGQTERKMDLSMKMYSLLRTLKQNSEVMPISDKKKFQRGCKVAGRAAFPSLASAAKQEVKWRVSV